MKTVFQCLQQDDRQDKPWLSVVHYAETERGAMQWLSDNGGGVYRNLLHRFECHIKPGDFPRKDHEL